MKYIDKILTFKSLFKRDVGDYVGWFQIKHNIKIHLSITYCTTLKLIIQIMFRQLFEKYYQCKILECSIHFHCKLEQLPSRYRSYSLNHRGFLGMDPDMISSFRSSGILQVLDHIEPPSFSLHRSSMSHTCKFRQHRLLLLLCNPMNFGHCNISLKNKLMMMK